jgi:multimeric flavodoxin WrbA
MTTIAIVFHSGYGHTARMAEHVAKGAGAVVGANVKVVPIDANGDLPEGGWETLNAADGIIFGAPTYMGMASWQFKKFADASSKPWMAQTWKDKFAAGFTNSGTMNGDKHSTLHYMITLAMQQSMIWISTGIMPSNVKASTRNDINYVGSAAGAMSTTPVDAGVDEMLPGDLATAEAFGKRVAEAVLRFAGK